MKIAFLAPFNLFDAGSGAAQSVRTVLEQLAAIGAQCHAVTACCFDTPPGEAIGELLRSRGLTPTAHIAEVNVPVWQGRVRAVDYEVIQFPNQARYQLTALEEWVYRDTLRLWLAQQRPDIVLTYGGFLLDIEIQRCARAAGARVVFYLANPHYLRPETFEHVDCILANSKATQDLFRRTMELESHAVGLFVDTRDTTAAARDPQYVTFINPAPEKGVSLFVKLLQRAAAEAPDMRFLVVESRATLAAALDRMGLSRELLSQVTILPKQENIAAVYAQTAVLLVPSFWFEAAGRVLMEANANGIPVLASNGGGIPETLGGAGCLLPIPESCRQDYWASPTAAELDAWWMPLLRVWRDRGHRDELSALASAVARKQSQSLTDKAQALYALLRSMLPNPS